MHEAIVKIKAVARAANDINALPVGEMMQKELGKISMELMFAGARLAFEALLEKLHEDIELSTLDWIVAMDHGILSDYMTPTDWDICGGGPGEGKPGRTPVDFDFEHPWVESCWSQIGDSNRDRIIEFFEEKGP